MFKQDPADPEEAYRMTAEGDSRATRPPPTIRPQSETDLRSSDANDDTGQLLNAARGDVERSARVLRTMFDGARDVLLLSDDRGQVIDANPAAAILFGLAHHHILGQTLASLSGAARDDGVAERIARARGKLTGRFTLLRPGGKRRVVSYHTVRDVTPGLHFTVCTDVTDRVEAEEELGASRYLLEEAQSIAQVGSWRSGVESWEPIQWSREAFRIYGLPEDTTITIDTFFARIHADDRERVLAASRAAREDRAPYDVEHRIVRDDGEIRWVHQRGTVQRDVLGRPQAMIGTVQDVTERHKADEMLARLAAIVSSSMDAIFSVGLDGRVSSWNCSAEALYGYSQAEMLGQPATRVARFEDIDLQRVVFDAAVRGGPVARFETTHQRKDLSLVDVEITVSAIHDATGEIIGVATIAHDLTSRRKARELQVRTEEQYRHSQKMEAVGRLAGGVAHDFNNLLSVILSYASLALEVLPPDSPIGEDLEQIASAGERATALTRQLLAFSRRQVLQPKVVELDRVLAGMRSMLARLLGEDIALTVESPSDLGRVRVDPGQVEQILMNLAVNARDAMPQGGALALATSNRTVEVSDSGKPPCLTPGKYVVLSVTDNGCGMSPEVQAKIFEPFFTTKEQGKGTGLGLATVFGIVQQSGGAVQVESEVGRGTTFLIYLPRTEDPVHSTVAHTEPESLRGTETILLVEDEDQVRAVAGTMLRRYGYHVLEAANGGEAYLVAKEFAGKIDLLLTDVVMPRMSGTKVAEEITAKHPGIRVLFTSGYTDDAMLHHGVLNSGVAFLQKPFTPDLLLQKVRDVLESKRRVTA